MYPCILKNANNIRFVVLSCNIQSSLAILLHIQHITQIKKTRRDRIIKEQRNKGNPNEITKQQSSIFCNSNLKHVQFKSIKYTR